MWTETVVSFSCCITATRKAELRPRACKLFKPTPQTRCQATRSICVNWGYTEKRNRALLIIESGNGSAGWLGIEALRSVYLGASSRSQSLPHPHSTPPFSSPLLCVLVKPCPPRGCTVCPLAFQRMKVGCWFLAWASISLLLMLVLGPQKSKGSERLELCECQSPRNWGFCGCVEIQMRSLRGVSRLARRKDKLKSNLVTRRLKRQGFRETRDWPRHGLTHPIYNTLS